MKRLHLRGCFWVVLCFCTLFALFPAFAAGDDVTGPETVKVGWYEDSYHITGANGERTGYAYEYEQAVAGYTGWNYAYVKGDWDELLGKLEDGEIDLMASLSYTDERAENMLFSELPMGEEKYYLYADLTKGDISASDLSSLNGRRIIVMAASVQEEQFSQWEESQNIQTQHIDIENMEDARRLIEAGGADGVISTETPIWVDYGMSTVATVGGSEIYYGVSKNRPDLKEALDSAMRSMEYDKPFYSDDLYKKYLASQSTAVLSESERDWVDRHSAIKMGYLTNDHGVSTLDQSGGSPSGIINDYVAYARDCLYNQSLQFDLVGYDSQASLMEALENGSIDMVFHVSQNPYIAEQEKMSLSNTVWTSNVAAITAKGSFDEAGEDTVAIVKDDQLLKWYVSYNYPRWAILEYDTQDDVMKAVRNGEADCFVVRASRVAEFVQGSAFHATFLTKPNDVSFAVRRGDTVLLSILNKTLKGMPDAMLTGALSSYDASFRKVTLMDFMKDNLIPVSVVFFLIFALVMSVVLGLLRKATRAATQARELNASLRESQRATQEALAQAESANAAKTTFLSNVSHDIRTPMNAIVGIANLMEHEQGDPQKLGFYIHKIQSSSKHLMSLINDVLDMSKIESGEVALSREAVSLAEQVRQVDNIIRPQAVERDQTFHIGIHDIVHEHVITDGLRLRQVLLNLLSNAVKYTPFGGAVSFDLSELPCDNPGRASYLIAVEDTGCGMAPEFIEHIFESFTRAENSVTNKVQGTGLGMAITKNVVDMMGGTIVIQSELGKGSRFEVRLSFTIDGDADCALDVRSVLLISKDDELVGDLTSALKTCAACLAIAPTIQAAVEAIGNEAPEVILVDGELVRDGLGDAIGELRGRLGDGPLILVCDYAYSEQAEEDLSACGADGLVCRPVFLSSLVAAVECARGDLQAAPNSGSTLAGKRFLCAEDNELNAEILEAILKMNGASCAIYPDGEQLVRAFERVASGDYDAILMDVQMPVMNGLEATRAIRRGTNPLGKVIPIIAMTANAFTEDIQRCLDAGMDAHVSKPLDVGALERAMRGLTGGRPTPAHRS